MKKLSTRPLAFLSDSIYNLSQYLLVNGVIREAENLINEGGEDKKLILLLQKIREGTPAQKLKGETLSIRAFHQGVLRKQIRRKYEQPI